MTLPRRLVVEVLGTALLLVAVVGSGIMGERLAGGNVAIALLANAVATGATLIALIYIFGPMSGLTSIRPSRFRSLGEAVLPGRKYPAT